MPDALILSHGSPSDPEPQEAAMQALAAAVAEHLPGWRVAGATLAAAGALEAALAGLTRPLVYPFFMADGWFTTDFLPRKLAVAGAPGLPRLPAFGLEPDLPDLCTRVVAEAAAAAGFARAETVVLLAAHGSAGRSEVARASARGTAAMAAAMQAAGGFRKVRTGFVEEPPFLSQAAKGLGRMAVCLPFFALRAGHVTGDLPEALAKVRYAGVLLPPVGAHPDVPAIIAAGLARGLARGLDQPDAAAAAAASGFSRQMV